MLDLIASASANAALRLPQCGVTSNWKRSQLLFSMPNFSKPELLPDLLRRQFNSFTIHYHFQHTPIAFRPC